MTMLETFPYPPNVIPSADKPSDLLRYSLSRDWSSRPRALIIGCNPSDADSEDDDPTVQWWLKWFFNNGYGGFDVCNLYPFVTPHPSKCREIISSCDVESKENLFKNLALVRQKAAAASIVFVCWGNIAWDNDHVKSVISELKSIDGKTIDLWCWIKNKNGSPRHPLARGKHRIPLSQPAILWSQQAI